MTEEFIPTQEQLDEINRRVSARLKPVTVGNRAVMDAIVIMVEEYKKMETEHERKNGRV